MNNSTSSGRISILSLNVGRSRVAQEAILEEASQRDVDVLLLQEPYYFRELARRITRRHPSFECFTPTDNWVEQPPRVISFVRKKSGIPAEQLRLVAGTPQRDLLFLSLQPRAGPPLLLINIYNAPASCNNPNEAAPALQQIPRALLCRNTLIAGDFNLRHPRWQPSVANVSPGANAFVEWLDTTDLSLLSDIDEATHDLGNVLDLVLGSGPHSDAASAGIDESFDVLSDHVPLRVSLSWGKSIPEATTRLRPDTVDKEFFQKELSMLLRDTPSRAPVHPAQLDNYTEQVISAVARAYGASAKRSLGHGKGHPWWTEQCTEAVKLARSARRRLDVDFPDARRHMRKVLDKAKTTYYNNKVSEAREPKDVFSFTKWHKTIGSFRSAPLSDPLHPAAPPAVTLADKRRVLATNLLTNQADVDDIPLDSPSVPRRALYLPGLTDPEIDNCVLNAGNTAPGADEIPTAILRLAWPQIQGHCRSLFRACVAAGHHPAPFRSAVLAMLQKPNKSDLSSPRSYRPIALLSVLGKGLERLLAKRMSWLAVSQGILHQQQFGALPKRSATDLTTCLTHDVEVAKAKGLVSSLITLDVKGAFDAVLPGRLVRRLREQGWPDELVRWVGSFATNRTVQIRLDGEVGPSQEVHCGLPQGSPISPILFMLYIAPLFRVVIRVNPFGYADDVALLATSSSLEENTERLREALAAALQWGAEEGITFDRSKSELIHFTTRRVHRDPASLPSVEHGDFSVKPLPDKPYLRWLGVLFDAGLTFQYHIQMQASKALRVAKALRSLGCTTRGAPPLLLRQAAIACVLAVAYFASEVWWPGTFRIGPRGRITSTSMVGAVKKLQGVVHEAARAILPVYRTTPGPALVREAGLKPADIDLDHRSRNAALRVRRLDPNHPLRARYRQVVSRARAPPSRFGRHIRSTPTTEWLDPLARPPWEPTKLPHPAAPHSFFPRDLVVYTDGSCLPDGRLGAGALLRLEGMDRQLLSEPVTPPGDAFVAETYAALRGAKAALALPGSTYARDLWILTDCRRVVDAYHNLEDTTLSQQFNELRAICREWPTRRNRPQSAPPGVARVAWVKGHAGNRGNEAAHTLALVAARLPPERHPAPGPHPIHMVASYHRELLRASLTAYWLTEAPSSYQGWGLPMTSQPPAELSLPREALRHLYAARSGHGDFAAYHERFNHEDFDAHCSCGQDKTPTHFYFCAEAAALQPAIRCDMPDQEAIKYLLGDPQGVHKFVTWADLTPFFRVHAKPRHWFPGRPGRLHAP